MEFTFDPLPDLLVCGAGPVRRYTFSPQTKSYVLGKQIHLPELRCVLPLDHEVFLFVGKSEDTLKLYRHGQIFKLKEKVNFVRQFPGAETPKHTRRADQGPSAKRAERGIAPSTVGARSEGRYLVCGMFEAWYAEIDIEKAEMKVLDTIERDFAAVFIYNSYFFTGMGIDEGPQFFIKSQYSDKFEETQLMSSKEGEDVYDFDYEIPFVFPATEEKQGEGFMV